MMYRRIARARRADHAVRSATIPTRISRSPRAAWSGCRTPTRRPAAIPYSTPIARPELHPQLHQGHDGCLRRHDHLPRRRSHRIPIAQTIGKVFPGLLKPLEAMPETLRTRLRYPQQIFALQAAMFATFHMTSPAVFYNREDQWEIPTFDSAGQPAGADASLLHDHEAAGRDRRRVHPDAAVHAARERQPRGVDGRAQRRRQLRPARRLPVPEADGDLRTAAGGRPHQPGPGDLAADHAVEPAGVGSDPGHAAGDSRSRSR